jgi:type 2 lantibiotic biosynthesis protein LanM
MDAFFERLQVRAATLDERLSDEFEVQPGQAVDADLAARRLAAWCRASAAGDWSLFERRLKRDGLSVTAVLARFATARPRIAGEPPAWVQDAIWIDAALRRPQADATDEIDEPFGHLLIPIVDEAEMLLWSSVDARVLCNLHATAWESLCGALLAQLCALMAPALYERFAAARNAPDHPSEAAKGGAGDDGRSLYDQFIIAMKNGGIRRLFDDKPVLLRLISALTRQWIETTREFLIRLDADLPIIRRDLFRDEPHGLVVSIESDLSDPHNDGRAVKIVGFADGPRVVYKPKDVRIDEAWHALIDRLNGSGGPIDLRAMRTIARNGYGWTEFVDHVGCDSVADFPQFFRRAGAWLALFHCFAGIDMHQENMIAAGSHPVPIDLEMMLQAAPGRNAEVTHAFDAATDTIDNSVMSVGLLPAYGRLSDDNIFAIGGVTSNTTARSALAWKHVNSDTMRPFRAKREAGATIANLPHVDGHHARLGDHVEEFIAGFEEYVTFLGSAAEGPKHLFDGFAGVAVRKVIRPTRFYYMLLQRLKDHRAMDDGVVWSAQVDFVARFSDWDSDRDPSAPMQASERRALLALNVPHFTMASEGTEVGDATGLIAPMAVVSGLERARMRRDGLDAAEVAWQMEITRQSIGGLSRSVQTSSRSAVAAPTPTVRPALTAPDTTERFIAEADKVAETLSRHAIVREASAAWIGQDWLGDSEVSQLVALGPDLYNGACGIALFFAAHAAVTGKTHSAEFARMAVARLRMELRGRSAARLARALGIGGATGMGSIVYALTVMSRLLDDEALRADAETAASLMTDELIACDTRLDVLGGSAGAILGLLCLHRTGRSPDALRRAMICGMHLLAQPRVGAPGSRSWCQHGTGGRPLNGMSHGAAGFAHALASLAAESGRAEFATAASECVAFENASYDEAHHNWPDLRFENGARWPSKWCHGAPGIGLSRLAMIRCDATGYARLEDDVRNALAGMEKTPSGPDDTLCCGVLGKVEFLREAGATLGDADLRALAARQLIAVFDAATTRGDFRWRGGKSRFNLGLFRGLAGVGYTALRQADASLPNILTLE